MIKKLQKQFIAIAMISILLVLILIMACINLINYSHVVDNANWRLELLADNGGQFPMEDIADRNGEPPLPKNKLGGMDTFPRRHMSVETPFDSRYFVVTLDADNHILTTDTNHIAAISEEDAKSYALLLAQKNKTQGFLSYYRYTAVRQTTENGEDVVMYLFLDCQKDLSTFYNFLWASIGISVLGLVLVFSLVLFFSRLIVRPIAESYEKQKQFITNASHEIKTPLTIIDANTEVLEMEQGENEWTISTHNQIKRLSELTGKLVFLSRMDEESTRLNMLDFSLSDAVLETAKPYETVAATQHRTFSYEIAPDIRYHGDESTIRQLVSLLLDNAVKYSSEGGQIRLALCLSGKNKILTVWNTTEQLACGKQDILFERFYRPDASRNSDTGGHGIGLSVAQAIVHAHKGKISARSEDGHSILFTVTL